MKSGRRSQFATGVSIALCLLAAASSLAQSTPSAAYQPFLGTWTSQLQGKTFLTLNIVPAKDSVGGTMTGASVHIDGEGNLTSAEPRDVIRQLIEVSFNDGVLSFKTKEGDHDPVAFDMKLDGANSGELYLKIPASPGAPTPKPWKLRREDKPGAK